MDRVVPMNWVLKMFAETIAGSAETVARAVDERQRLNGLVEAPDEHTERAALMRDYLRAEGDEAALLALAKEILGGVRGTLLEDFSAARHSCIRRSAAWVWDVLGRLLKITDSDPRAY